jgi:orotidine-5'-phosphate decarboxylase
VRALAPTLPLLVPGIGAQGGDAQATVRAGWRADGPVVVSSSRAVLYAWVGAGGGGAAAASDPGWVAAARAVALATRAQLRAAQPSA